MSGERRSMIWTIVIQIALIVSFILLVVAEVFYREPLTKLTFTDIPSQQNDPEVIPIMDWVQFLLGGKIGAVVIVAGVAV